MISENVPNFSGPYFLIGKLELRQYLPTKIIVNAELNENKQAQFLAEHQSHTWQAMVHCSYKHWC